MAENKSIHDVGTLINQFIASSEDELRSRIYSREIAISIEGKNVSLLDFVHELGPSITSENNKVRLEAVHCMADTISALDEKVLLKQDVAVFIDFLLNKIEDIPSLPYVMAALISIVSCANFVYNSNDKAISIIGAIKEHYEPRKHLAKVRNLSFILMRKLLEKNSVFFLGSQEKAHLYIQTFIHIASGEKDPRNLIESFKINANISKAIPLNPENKIEKMLIDELFDICFCYYPISFTPPPNDPYKITAQDLKNQLNATIVAQNGFARDAFTELLQKLTSTNPVIRNDVLRTLKLCVESYSDEEIEKNWIMLWDGLKFEILHNDVSIFKPNLDYIIPVEFESELDDDDSNKAVILTLLVIQRLAERLASCGKLDRLTSTAIKEVESNLKLINDKTWKQSVLVLSAISSTSPEPFNTITEFLFSFEVWGKFIHPEFRDDTQIQEELDTNANIFLNVSKQRDLIDAFGYVFIAYDVLLLNNYKNNNSTNNPDFVNNNALIEKKDELLVFMGQLLESSSNIEKTLKCKIIQQLFSLLRLRGFLDDSECNLVLGYYKSIILKAIENNESDWEKDIVLNEVRNCLVRLTQNNSPYYSNHTVICVETNFLPDILEFLKPKREEFDVNDFFKQFKRTLKLVSALCLNHHLFEVLSIRLLNKAASLNDLVPNQIEFLRYLLFTMVQGLKSIEEDNEFLLNRWYKNFVPRLLKLIIDKMDVARDDLTIELAGDLLGIIIKYNDVSYHQTILEDIMGSFFLNSASHLRVTLDILNNPNPIVSIVNKGLANIDRGGEIKFHDTFTANELIYKISSLCHRCDEEFTKIGYLQLLTVLSNKFLKDENIVYLFINEHIELEKCSLDKESVENFEASIWLLKGLIMRLEASSLLYLDKIASMLSAENKEIQFLAAKSFDIIMTDLTIFKLTMSKKKQLISKVHLLNIRLLFKQRVFDRILPVLVSGYNQSDNSSQYCLLALSFCLNGLPDSVLKQKKIDILPMILVGLQSESPIILHASLATCELLLQSTPELFSSHLSTLISILVSLSVNKVVVENEVLNDENTRLTSFACLQLIFSSLKTEQVLPYKNSVLTSLARGSDDKRRAVRKRCNDVRQILFELGR